MARQLLRGLPLLSALAAPALAQSTSVVEVLLPGFDTQTVLASVVNVDSPSKTTYFLTCPTDEDETECGLGSGITVVEGPSTFAYHQTETGVLTADVSCQIASSTAVCTSSLDESGYDESASSSFAVATGGVATITDLSTLTGTITITAGLEKLSGATASQTAATGQPTSASGSSTGSTGATAAGSSSSTAGMPQITGNAVFAGVAAIVGGAMMM